MKGPPADDSVGSTGSTIASFLERYGVPLSCAWGFAEATLFFIVPDVMVGAVALFSPRRWWRAAAAALIGALIGASVLVAVTWIRGESMRNVMVLVPAISEAMVYDVADQIDDQGARAMLAGPSAGVPFKVYIVESVLESVGIASILAWGLAARVIRIVPVAAIAALFGVALRGPLHEHQALFLGLYVLVWVTGYIVFFSVVV